MILHSSIPVFVASIGEPKLDSKRMVSGFLGKEVPVFRLRVRISCYPLDGFLKALRFPLKLAQPKKFVGRRGCLGNYVSLRE